MVGWDEIAAATLLPTSIVQHWRPDASRAQLGGVAAPDSVAGQPPLPRHEVRRQHDARAELGGQRVGQAERTTGIRRLASGAAADAMLGIEAPIWSETLANMRDVEFMAFPRLAAVADLAWAPVPSHNWEEFRARLAARRRGGPRSASTSIARPAFAGRRFRKSIRRCEFSWSRPTIWVASRSAWRHRRPGCGRPGTTSNAWM